MVSSQVKHSQGSKLRNLRWDSAPYEVGTEIQSLQGTTVREMKRDGLVEDVISKVEIRQIWEVTNGR